MIEGIDPKIVAVGPGDLQPVPADGLYFQGLHVARDFDLFSRVQLPEYSRLSLAHGARTCAAQMERLVDRMMPVGPCDRNSAVFRDGQISGFHYKEKTGTTFEPLTGMYT